MASQNTIDGKHILTSINCSSFSGYRFKSGTDAPESYTSDTRESHIYFMKDNPDKADNSDIYVSKKINGIYQQPENMGMPVNTTQFRESNPFISAKEDYIIYFSSDSTGLGEVDCILVLKRTVNGCNQKIWEPRSILLLQKAECMRISTLSISIHISTRTNKQTDQPVSCLLCLTVIPCNKLH